MNIILKDPELLEAFDNFCCQNHAEENLHFYLEVEAFKALEEHQDRVELSLELFGKYIKSGADRQLGMVTQEEREVIQRFCSYPVVKMFNGVQRRALMELTSSILPDFSQSSSFKTYFKASGYSEADTLDEILSDPYQSVLFQRYLATVGVLDCFKFIKANEYFASLTDKEDLMKQAFWIYTVFLDTESISPIELVRIPISMRKNIQTKIELECVSPHLFADIAAIMLDEMSIYVCGYYKSPSAEIYARSKEICVSPGVSAKESPRSVFSRIRINGIEFKNRLGARISDAHRSKNGIPNSWVVSSVGNMVMNGVSHICIDNVAVDINGQTCTTGLGIWNNEQADKFSEIVDLAKEEHAIIGIQLTHSGRKTTHQPAPVAYESPTTSHKYEKIPKPGDVISSTNVSFSEVYDKPTMIQKKFLADILKRYCDAAKFAVAAGFDMIEIQAGKGHLIHQFLSPLVNKRTDSYGGSFEGRIRFCVEVVKAVKKVIPSNTLLACQVSCGDPGPDSPWSNEESAKLVAKLKTLGVHVIVCSSGGVTNSEIEYCNPGAITESAKLFRAQSNVEAFVFSEPSQDLTSIISLIDKNVADIIYISEGLQRQPNLIYQIADHLEEIVFYPPRDAVVLDV